ncbi:MAG: hypothetical protein ACREQL_15020, partial [Candidatus Binatia bacterium]
AEVIIRGFEIEAVIVFVLVGWRVLGQYRATRTLGPLGCLFVGGLVVALFGDPVANWGLTALYNDTFHLLPRAMGWGLSPAQSWACVFAYPWCFPMMAYAGRWLARRLGSDSAMGGFASGSVVGGTFFVLSVPMTFVPHQVIVYQQAPPWPLTLFAGTPAQVQLLDVAGIATFIGLCSAMLMPASGASRFERWLPTGTLARAGFSSALLLGMFLLCFSPALAVRALGLDIEVGYARSPFRTVPLYGQVEAYSQEVVDNFVAACSRQGDLRSCRCAIDAIRRRFTIDEYRDIEARLAKGEAPKEFVAAVDDCR